MRPFQASNGSLLTRRRSSTSSRKTPKYLPLVNEVFERIEAGSLTAITSAITLTEVLTHPLRLGKEEIRKSYFELLVGARNFATLPIEISMAATAAQLRARYGFRTPDALQLACGIGAAAMVVLSWIIALSLWAP